MSDTIRTLVDNLNRTRDGQVAKSITPQVVRDILVSTTYCPTITGETGVVSERYPYGDVRRHGADPTGVANSQAAVQAAVTSAAATFGVVTARAGTYLLASGVTWATGVSLFGDGMARTKFTVNGPGYPMFLRYAGVASDGSDGAGAAWLEDCVFAHFCMDGAGATNTAPSVDPKGLFMLYLRRCKFIDLLCKNTVGTGFGNDFLDGCLYYGCVAKNCGRLWEAGWSGQSGFGIGTGALQFEPTRITECYAYDCGNYGFFLEQQRADIDAGTAGYQQSEDYIFTNCYAEGNNSGLCNMGAGATTFLNCTSRLNTLYGLELSNPKTVRGGTKVLGGRYIDNASDGIHSIGATGHIYIGGGVEAAYNGDNGIMIEYGTRPFVDLWIEPGACHDNKNNGLKVTQAGEALTIRGHYLDNGNGGTAGQMNNVLITDHITRLSAAPVCEKTSGSGATVESSFKVTGTITTGVIDARNIRDGTTPLDLGGGSHTDLAVYRKRLTAKATWNPPALATATQQTTTVTVTGAVVGGTASVNFSLALSGTRLWAEVTSADTVTVYHRNDTGGAVDIASGTLYVLVEPVA